MRKDLGCKPFTYPQPVFILVSVDEKGHFNAMNAAWGGISEENEISICLSSNHRTVLDILKTKLFSISMGTAEQVEACDYVGIESGNKVENKLEKANWHPFLSPRGCPLIEELPFAVECRLKEYDKDTCIMKAEILNVSVDEKILTNGKVDPKKLRPICFDPCNNAYLEVGDKVADAFRCGLKLR